MKNVNNRTFPSTELWNGMELHKFYELISDGKFDEYSRDFEKWEESIGVLYHDDIRVFEVIDEQLYFLAKIKYGI